MTDVETAQSPVQNLTAVWVFVVFACCVVMDATMDVTAFDVKSLADFMDACGSCSLLHS